MESTKGGWEVGDIETLTAAVNSPLPRFYVNGFMNSLSPTDVISVLVSNSQPVAILNFSFSTVKTWATALLDLITQLESDTKQPILMAGEIATAVNNRTTQTETTS